MNNTNLLPRHRLNRLAFCLRKRRWATAIGSSFVGLLAIYAAWATFGPPRPSLIATEPDPAAEISRLSIAAKGLDGETRSITTMLDSSKLVSGQPDMGILMACLSSSLDPETFLSRVEFGNGPATGPALTTGHPVPGPGAVKSAATPEENRPPSPARLMIVGFAKSQTDLSRFVRRLEGSAIFDRVTIVQSSNGTVLSGDALTFKLECRLTDGGGQ